MSSFEKKVGSRLQVWNKVAEKTKGNLTKKNLVQNSSGKIVSKKASDNAKRLNNLGAYLAKKGSPCGKIRSPARRSPARRSPARRSPSPRRSAPPRRSARLAARRG